MTKFNSYGSRPTIQICKLIKIVVTRHFLSIHSCKVTDLLQVFDTDFISDGKYIVEDVKKKFKDRFMDPKVKLGSNNYRF